MAPVSSEAIILALSSGVRDAILGASAAVLIVFSLVVALVVPRRWPEFPGRHLGLFMLLAALLVLGMLTSVEVVGEAHHFNRAEAGTVPPTTTQSTTGASTGKTTGTTTGAAAPKGNPAAGKQVFAANGCATCHTYKPAGSTAKVGPDLDKLADYARQAKKPLEEFTRTSIVDPNAYIQPGFPPNTMPTNFGQKLSDQQLADLVAFLTQES